MRFSSRAVTLAAPLLLAAALLFSNLFNLLPSPAFAANAPTITSVTPNSGPTAGGNLVTINGSGFYSPYIQFNGTQYIDTGISAPGVYDFVIDYMNSVSSGQNWAFGERFGSVGYNAEEVGLKIGEAGDIARIAYAGNVENVSNATARNIRHKISKVGTMVMGDNVSRTLSNGNSSITPYNNIDLGSTNYGGNVNNHRMIGRIYAFKLYLNGSLVADYHPVQAGSTRYSATAATSDGFWDSVSSTYKTTTGLTYGYDGAADGPEISTVTFGGVNAQSFTIDSDTQITAVVPASALPGNDTTPSASPFKEGKVDVVLTNSIGEVATLPQSYTYQAPMSISAVTPPSGSVNGGETVTISGHNFVPATGTYTDGTSYYAPMNYITFTGAERIDTGITANSTTLGSLDFEITGIKPGANMWTNILVLSGAGNSDPRTFYFQINPAGQYYVAVAGAIYTPSSYLTGRHLFELSMTDRSVNIDGNLLTSTTNALTYPSAGTANFGVNMVGRVYGYQMWQNGSLATDMLPVYNLATGEGGMWDTVSGQFFGSATSTKFAGGPSALVSFETPLLLPSPPSPTTPLPSPPQVTLPAR